MAEGFAEPQAVAGLEAAALQDAAHVSHTTAAGIGEHRQGAGALLQAARQGRWVASMQADPLGVLPGPAQAGEGQLQRTWPWMEAQLLAPQAFDQDPADPEPERITTGQHHRLLIRLQLSAVRR